MGISRSAKGRLTGTQAEDSRQDYVQLASGANLSPGSITAAVREADQGRIRRLVEMVCDVRGGRDFHTIGVEQTRRGSLSGKPWEILPRKVRGIETPPEVVDACRALIEDTPGCETLIGEMQDAVSQPLSAHEIIWDVSSGMALPVAVESVHPKRFAWNTAYTDVAGLYLGELRLMTDDERTYGVRLAADKWIIHQAATQTDYPWRRGLGRALLWYEGFKSFGWKFWSVWLEVCAMPLRLAEVPETMPLDERDRVEAALAQLGTDSYAVVSSVANVRFEASGNQGGDQSYQRMIDACNTEISKAYLGHSGAADTTPGRLGGEGLAGEIRQDLVEADARSVESTINRQLLAPFVRMNWGLDVPAPRLHLQVDAMLSRREIMDLAGKAWSYGMPVDAVWLASTTGVQLTSDPSRMLPPPGPQGTAQTVAGTVAPQQIPGMADV